MHQTYTLLIATANDALREFHTRQLDADDHTIYQADHAAAVTAKLSAHAIDVLILGDLEQGLRPQLCLRQR